LSNALITAVQSMHNDMRYMETVSQNMVNIATPGYKRAIPVAPAFGEALRTAAEAGGQQVAVPAVSSVLDLSAGAVKQTGRSLDLAIGGDGYFELATTDGPAYTRAGDFRLDARGRLVSQNGDPVQGLQGEIIVNGSAVTVDASGRLFQEGQVVAQLKIVRFANPKLLSKNGAGLLKPAGTQTAELDQRSTIQAGYLENSNVMPMREMMALMETTRHFEATQKLFQGYDEALGNAIGKLGQF
jgi:flagellar basal-body rod protein FlgF